MLSAFIISPENFFARSIANLDLPDAVGPEIKIILSYMLNVIT
jgi:hypothetical protein